MDHASHNAGRFPVRSAHHQHGHGGHQEHFAPHHHHHNHHHQPHSSHNHHPPHHGGHHRPPGEGPPAKWHSFKMLVDPLIHRGAPKMVRYDGSVVPGNPHHVPPTPSDPRKKLPSALWKRLEPMELPVPKLKIDENYVGEPPKVEVTIENLNDNVDKHFLNQMVCKYGELQDLMIYFHPITKKHLGLARLLFVEVRSAKECVKQLHGKSVMGKQLNCYIDPCAASCKKMFQELTEEKKPEVLVENEESPKDDEKPPSPKEKEHRWERRDRDPRGSTDSRERLERRSSSDHRKDKHRRRSENSRDRNWRHESRTESNHDDKDESLNSTDVYNSVSAPMQNPPPNVIDPQIPPLPPPPPIPLDGGALADSQYHAPSFDPQYNHPDYWLQKAQQFAAAAAAAATTSTGTVVPEVVTDNVVNDAMQTDEAAKTSDQEEKGESEGEDHKVDLDTRLKMLMKDRSGTMPAFLLEELNGSESEVEEGETKDTSESQQAPSASVFPLQPDEVPLSRPPSPFLSPETYLQCHQDWVSEKRRLSSSQESREINETLNDFSSNRPHERMNGRRPISRNSDRMSLSSLSSGENNILEQGPGGSLVYPPSHYDYYAQTPGFPGQWAGGEGGAGVYQVDPYSQQYPPHMQDPNAYHHYGTEGYYGQQGWTGGHPYEMADNKKPNSQDNIQALLNDCVSAFVKDLKRTLRKDMKKKMCETFAFYHYEKWWQEQEEKYKQRQSKSTPSKPPGIKSSSSNADLGRVGNSNKNVDSNYSSEANNRVATSNPTTVAKAADLSSIFDKQREKLESSTNNKALSGALGMGGSLGFGFRGTIPKLPSFKRKVESASADRRRKGSPGSSDDDRRTKGGKSKSKHEKRKDHEKRRENRMHKEQEKERTKEIQKKEKKKKHEAKSDKRTLDSIYSAIYSGESVDADKRSSSDVEIQNQDLKAKKKSVSQKRDASSSAEESVQSSSGESSEESEAVSVFSSSPTTSSESSYSEPSSESPSSSESEEVEEDVKRKTKSEAKKKTSKPVVPPSATESSDLELGLESDSEDGTSRSRSVVSIHQDTSKATSRNASSAAESADNDNDSNVDEQQSDVTPTPSKKPVPVRRPSLLLQTQTDEEATPITNKQLAAVDTPSVPENSSPHIMDHCYAKPSTELEEDSKQQQFENQFANDHGYTRPRTPPRQKFPTTAVAKPEIQNKLRQALQGKKTTKNLLSQSTPLINTKTFKARESKEQFEVLYKFLTKGLDLEDIGYLKRSYEMMLNKQDRNLLWLNDTHWVDHSVTDLPDPPRKRRKEDFSRPHLTGSCRTEGYYKMDPREKARTKYHLLRSDSDLFAQTKIANMDGLATKGRLQTAQSLSREARSAQRRQLAVLGDEVINSDLLKFNQLKFRRKQMIFGKSAIHDWGLFALEDIGADEMVIEYVGQVIRPVTSDVREIRYQKQGIGSSYLFRIDSDNVVDATKRGNLARFINHSCDPNCYAKVITVDQQKKIVIYSKQPIAVGEEITYDYKFEIEEEKISCLCGAKNCRKYLN